jgi:glucans biosynthesis protein
MKSWTVVLLVFGFSRVLLGQSEPVFGFNDLARKAQQLAAQPFTPQLEEFSPDLSRLDYDHYRRIRFLPERSVWRNLPYRLGFFHPGYYYNRSVLFTAIEARRARDIPFCPAYFHYDQPINFSGHEHFVGFRAYVPAATPGDQDEFMAFLGASYFRAIAKGLQWGLSSRGLGINTGASGPEEFPDFRAFWVRQPQSREAPLEFYALLDSESVTGAYRFDVRYGENTTMDVQVSLFWRKQAEVALLAPLTSMFYFGANTVDRPTLKPDYQPTGKMDFGMNKTDFNRREFRPQVHDSDGLLMDTPSGEKLWAPLENPKSMVIRQFADATGFSLMQRDRDVAHYLDQEAAYHRRPSLTVVPKNLGSGRVRLLELPSVNEYTDNIVAGWQPLDSPAAGARSDYSYQLVWRGDDPDQDQFRVVSTTLRPSPSSSETLINVEYARAVHGETIPVEQLHPLVLSGTGGEIKNVQFTPTESGWLVTFTVHALSTNPSDLELSCVILRGDKSCSEKWLYLLNT